jgi:acyl carrier protein
MKYGKDDLYGILAEIINSNDKNSFSFKFSDIKGKNLSTDIGLDSLDIMAFLFDVEEKFGIKLPDEDFDELGLMNLDNMVDYLTAKISQ